MKSRLIIFLIVLITIGLRIYNIEQKNLWFDEVYSWKISQGSIIEVVSETSGDIHPPLFYIVLKFWIKIFSNSIFSMRMLSVLFSALSIFFIYKLADLFLKDKLQVSFVLLLYAVSPLNIYYSQEVRMLNLNLLLCLGSVYYFFIFIRNNSVKSGLLYTLFTILALYTHYFAFLILITELLLVFVLFLFRKPGEKTPVRYLILFFTINILYIPWYPVLFTQSLKGQPWRTSQSAFQVGVNVIDYFKDIFLSPYYTFESNALLYFSDFISFFIIAFIFYSVLKSVNSNSFFQDKKNSIIFLFCIPLIIAVVVSFRQSIILSRYLSILLPYFFIMVVYFSFKFYSRRTSIIICIFLIASSCYGIYIYFDNGFKNNDYRKIISYLEENIESNDEIMAEPHFMGWIINYYISSNGTNLKPPKVLGWNLNMQLDSLSRMNDLKNIWFITDYSALDKTSYDSLTFRMLQLGYKKSVKKSFYIIPSKVNLEYYIKN